MNLYGVLYEDYTNGTRSAVDRELYTTHEAALDAARALGQDTVDELNDYDDESTYGPYSLEEQTDGGQNSIVVLNGSGVELEAFHVVNFTVKSK